MAKNIIGLDVGGTKITGIVFDGKKVLRALTIPTPKNLRDFKRSVKKLVEFLSAGRNIYGLGVGQAGIISPSSGLGVYNPNMKFLIGFNSKKFYAGLGFKKTKIENDANCFALAEAHFGKGKSFKNFIGITLGTGIGGGIIFNKEIYRGSHNGAGEAGHVMADFKHDSEYYYQLSRNRKDFKKLGQSVGILFANVMNLLDVDAIVLGGSVATTHGKQFLGFANTTAKKHVVNNKAMPKVVVSNLKFAGAIGAALLIK